VMCVVSLRSGAVGIAAGGLGRHCGGGAAGRADVPAVVLGMRLLEGTSCGGGVLF
jgi:hypothetical protein